MNGFAFCLSRGVLPSLRRDPALAGRQIYEYVDEGSYDANGKWVFRRRWNGDQTDYGLNFSSATQLLRVKLTSY